MAIVYADHLGECMNIFKGYIEFGQFQTIRPLYKFYWMCLPTLYHIKEPVLLYEKNKR